MPHTAPQACCAPSLQVPLLHLVPAQQSLSSLQSSSRCLHAAPNTQTLLRLHQSLRKIFWCLMARQGVSRPSAGFAVQGALEAAAMCAQAVARTANLFVAAEVAAHLARTRRRCMPWCHSSRHRWRRPRWCWHKLHVQRYITALIRPPAGLVSEQLCIKQEWIACG
jgi:hypothetical protein